MSRISRDIEEWFPSVKQKDFRRESFSKLWRNLAGWLPLMILPLTVCTMRNALAPWVFMWSLAFAIFFGCKWLTWWQCPRMDAPAWRHWAYLLLWPGMDARTFLDPRRRVAKPLVRDWAIALLKTFFGALLVWGFAGLVPSPSVAGWIGLVGCVFLLHFGTFHLVALMWQQLGVDAQPIMKSPLRAKSLAEFWGERWNSAFNLLVHDLLFRRLFRRVGAMGAMLVVFLVSGIIHDLLISFPARAGYGLPTCYFLLQGFGLCLQRSKPVQKWELRPAFAGRCFTVLVTAVPAFWLFHPPFIRNVILPMLHAIGAT